jgi:hypothetical protein
LVLENWVIGELVNWGFGELENLIFGELENRVIGGDWKVGRFWSWKMENSRNR